MLTEDWGHVGYQEAWDRQLVVVKRVQAGGEDTLILVEHPPVLTLGSRFQPENLLLSERQYASLGIDVIHTDRGGDVTYHGPGQLVIYPIFDIAQRGRDLHAWLRTLEQAMIDVCSSHGIAARRFPPHTGAWIGNLKVAAIGIKVKSWVSMHGVALNCDNDLAEFELIVPCGIKGYGVTSLTEASGRSIDVSAVRDSVVVRFRLV